MIAGPDAIRRPRRMSHRKAPLARWPDRVRKSGARQVVIAVPVAGSDALGLFRHEADAVICLREESNFWGIGEFYDDFSPVEDREVVRVLHAFERESAGSMLADPGGSGC